MSTTDLNRCKGNCNRDSKHSTSIKEVLPTLDEMKLEQLFLLEVLVNTIEVQKEPSQLKEHKDKDQEIPPIYVRVHFLDFPCIEISQDDFLTPEKDEIKEEEDTNLNTKNISNMSNQTTVLNQKSLTDLNKSTKSIKSVASKDSEKGEKVSKADRVSKGSGKGEGGKVKPTASKANISLSSGKSCLFPMSSRDLLKEIQRHPLELSVLRKKSTNQEFGIGQTKLKLGQEFEDAIIKSVYESVQLPITTMTEKTCKLLNSSGDPTGKLNIFVRLSCFGSSIVTGFHLLGEEKEGYIFKTSVKDNILPLQRKGDVLYNKSPYKKETITKSLDIVKKNGPLWPRSTEPCHMDSTVVGKRNPRSSSQCKVTPWRKYQKGCCSENSDERSETHEPVFGICDCGKEHLPPYIDQTRMCNVPPCPLPNCDCYSLIPPTSHKGRPLSSEQFDSERSTDMECCLGEGGKTCTDCQGSLSKLNRNITSKRDSCPVGDCDCYPNTSMATNTAALHQQYIDNNRSCPCQNLHNSRSEHCSSGDRARLNSGAQNISFQMKSQPVPIKPYSTRVYNQHSPTNYPTGDCIIPTKDQNLQNEKNNLPNNCPIEDCACNKNPHKLPGTNLQSAGQNCYTRQDMRQSFQKTGVNNTQAHNVEQNYCNCEVSTPSGEKQSQKRQEKCFFDDIQMKQPKSNNQNNCDQLGSGKGQTGYSNPYECKCFLEGTAGQRKNTADFNPEFTVKTGSGTVPMSQTGNVLYPSEEQTKPLVEEEIISRKVSDGLGGGDTNWNEYLSDQKTLPMVEKFEEPLKQFQSDEKKMEEIKEVHKKRKQRKTITPPNLNIKYEEKPISSISKQQKKKRRFRSPFYYSAGMYPGINIGHRHCAKEFRYVPKTMGWLWDLEDLGDNLKSRRGWRPGAINRCIKKMIREGKLARGLLVKDKKDDKKIMKITKKTRRPFSPRSKGGAGLSSNMISEDLSAPPQSPTMHLHKKDGAYFISMYPLKTDSDDEEEERVPLMFKILPNEDDVSTSSESSIEIEFTAPGAFRKKALRPVMETIDTQYSDPETATEPTPPPTPKGKKGAPAKK